MKLLAIGLLVPLLLTGCVGSGVTTPIRGRRNPPASPDYQAGYQDGRSDAIKDHYWRLRSQHHPDAWKSSDNVTLYPIPVPEHDRQGSRIQPTIRNLIIQK